MPSWFPDENNKVQGSFFQDQVDMLTKHGNKVTVFYPFAIPEPSLSLFLKHLFKKTKYPSTYNVSYVPLKAMLSTQLPPAFFFNFITKYFLQKAFKKHCQKNGRPDLIIAHSIFMAGLAASYLSGKNGIAYLLHMHSSFLIDTKLARRDTVKRIVEEVCAGSKKTFVVSDFYKQKLLELYHLPEQDLLVLPNIISADHVATPPPSTDKVFKWVCINFLNPGKNVSLLLRAFELISKSKKHYCTLAIAGDGPEREMLEGLAVLYGINSQVKFLGNVPKSEIRRLLEESHAIVSASKLETFGVSIIEALATGRPFVATNFGGVLAQLTAKDGIIVDNHTAQALAAGMEQMMENYSDYSYKDISKRCSSKFSDAKVYGKLAKFL